jgi:endonuclease G
MLKLTVTLFLLFIMSPSELFAQQSNQASPIFNGCVPFKEGDSSKIIVRELYALSNNSSTKFANWVAYRIDSALMSGADRPRNWKADPMLNDSETLEPTPDDYKGAYEGFGYDRGHLAPLASLDGPSSYYELNYLSNIAPQKSSMNRGPWKTLEDTERSLVSYCDYTYVFCGAVFEEAMDALPNCDESHRVPSSFWKVIICQTNSTTQTASFIVPQNAERGESIFTYGTTLKDISTRTGYQIMWCMPDAWLESNYDFIVDEWLYNLR